MTIADKIIGNDHPQAGRRLVVVIALSLFSTTLVTAGLGFVFWAVAAHITTTEVVGRSSAVVSAMQLIATFATLGLHTLLIAELPRHDGVSVKRLVVASLGIASGVAFTVAAGYAVVYHHAMGADEWVYASPLGITLFGVATAVSTATIVIDGALIGVQQSTKQVSRNLVFSLVKLIALPIGAFWVGMSPQVVLSVWLLGNVVSLLLLVIRTKAAHQWLTTTPSLRRLSPVWRTAAGHHWVNVATQAPRLAMPIIVATQLSVEANAGFYAALLIVSFIWIIPNHLGTAMFALDGTDPGQLGHGLDTALRLSALVSVVAAVGIPFLAGPLLEIFGPGYDEARYCLIALAMATFASAVKSIYIAVRRAQSALSRAAWAASLGGVLELAAVGAGLHFGGVTGVGIALSAAMTVEAVFFWPSIHKARRRTHQFAGAEVDMGSDGRAVHVSSANHDRARRSSPPAGGGTAMRILVDHSGYALLNIGDAAMLQACVRRIRAMWPDAEIDVITESPERLENLCPGTHPVAPTIVGRRGAWVLSKSGQLAAEQIWKIAAPLLYRSRRSVAGAESRSAPTRLISAARRADVVVSSGGGFINDVFWWHGAGVLSVMAMAQRLGKPTAMFGQGIGPLNHPLMSHIVRTSMPRLMFIGVREEMASVPLLKAHGVDDRRIAHTGDDALLVATRINRPPTGSGIGLNIRVAPYSGVDSSVAAQVVTVTRRAARQRGADTVAVPVSRYEADSDLRAVQYAWAEAESASPGDEYADLRTPEELAERIARCRVVVTGSYHAAVFGLAAGIPAVCVTNSRYYDGKFRGLAAQFPGGCHIVRPGPLLERELCDAIDAAWTTGQAARDGFHSAALALVADADEAYRRFKSMVDRCGAPAVGSGGGDVLPKGAAVLTDNDHRLLEELL